MFVCQTPHFARIGSDYGGHLKLGNSQSSANVSVGNIAAANEAYAQHRAMRAPLPFAIALSYPPSSDESILPVCQRPANEFRGWWRICTLAASARETVPSNQWFRVPWQPMPGHCRLVSSECPCSERGQCDLWATCYIRRERHSLHAWRRCPDPN